jgi:hypothetical protein
MNNQTVEKLRSMRLGAMAQLHQQYVKENRFGGITCDEYLALLTDHQWEDRENKLCRGKKSGQKYVCAPWHAGLCAT